MSQTFRKTILIVCEGHRSEPDYFQELRNEVLKRNSDIFITILPIPKDEQIEIDNDINAFKLRRGAKKRQLKNAIKEEPEEYIVEDEYKAQPTCYVRKAQLGYFEKNFSELWAIYDKDGHADHENAYLLSTNTDICEKIVNIGFSSISFEQWILMHFESCSTVFSKSQCRDKNKNYFDCGTNSHADDCHGENCVVGKIVESKYLPYLKSKNFNYKDYSMHVLTAFENALISREVAANEIEFYLNNPYVSIDRLVFKLRHIDKVDLIWNYNNTVMINRNIFIKIDNNAYATKIIIFNNSPSSYILHQGTLQFIDFDFKILNENSTKTIVESMKSELLFEFNKPTLSDFKYLLFKINDYESKILDVIQVKNF